MGILQSMFVNKLLRLRTKSGFRSCTVSGVRFLRHQPNLTGSAFKWNLSIRDLGRSAASGGVPGTMGEAPSADEIALCVATLRRLRPQDLDREDLAALRIE